MEPRVVIDNALFGQFRSFGPFFHLSSQSPVWFHPFWVESSRLYWAMQDRRERRNKTVYQPLSRWVSSDWEPPEFHTDYLPDPVAVFLWDSSWDGLRVTLFSVKRPKDDEHRNKTVSLLLGREEAIVLLYEEKPLEWVELGDLA